MTNAQNSTTFTVRTPKGDFSYTGHVATRDVFSDFARNTVAVIKDTAVRITGATHAIVIWH